ncbi:MAG: universal stress protein [Cytophagaceae bacterium]|jgi:nucleotide-binding universal stress UspA family protein|nr:universal stress protein [Cytophagaceae bacterium]
MKRILVPVDFSEDSVHAIDIAVDIANQLQANLRLMHVRTNRRYYPEFAQNNPDLLLADLDTKYLESLLARASKKYSVPNREIDFKIREGNVVKEITNQAYYEDSTLIVVGTHGVSGFEDRWVGSNAYRLVAHAPCPVLTVRKEMVLPEEKKILLPIDHSRITRRIVPMAAGFAQIMGAKIILAGINDHARWHLPGKMNIIIRQVERFLRKESTVAFESIILEGEKDTSSLLEYAHETNTTFIAIPVRKSANPFESFFNPQANELLNISDIPVLVVPEKDMY